MKIPRIATFVSKIGARKPRFYPFPAFSIHEGRIPHVYTIDGKKTITALYGRFFTVWWLVWKFEIAVFPKGWNNIRTWQ